MRILGALFCSFISSTMRDFPAPGNPPVKNILGFSCILKSVPSFLRSGITSFSKTSLFRSGVSIYLFSKGLSGMVLVQI